MSAWASTNVLIVEELLLSLFPGINRHDAWTTISYGWRTQDEDFYFWYRPQKASVEIFVRNGLSSYSYILLWSGDLADPDFGVKIRQEYEKALKRYAVLRGKRT